MFIGIANSIGQRFGGGAPFIGLLDTYSGAVAAYSLRQLSSSYSGSAIRVRRSSDNTEQDIGFASNELDVTALTSFCSGTNGFVTTWYDQSGNGNNATQTTAADQPKIYDSSTGVATENGKSTMVKNASNSGLFVVSANFSPTITDRTAFSVSRTTSAARQEIITGGFTWILNVNAISYGTNLYNGSSYINSSEGLITTQALRTGYFNSTGDSSVWTNNANQVVGAAGSNVMNSILRIGGQDPAFRIIDSIQEVILYPSNQSTNRTGIETNINDFYSIY